MIYIIDDDQSVLKALKLLLNAAGFNATAFFSAREFLEQSNISNNDCIILDLSMPDISGFDLIERLSVKGIDPKIIVITAYDDVEKREQAWRMKASAFLTKPVDDQALIDTIKWILQSEEENIRT